MSATFLPVYQLSEATAPTTSDYLVFQSAASGGDVGLLEISEFISSFIQNYIDQVTIDQTTIDLYTAMGWTDPDGT